MSQRTTKRSYDRDSGKWTGTLTESGESVSVEAWRFLVAPFDPVAKDATKEQKTAHQEVVKAAQESAREAWPNLDERVRYFVMAGINRDFGDMLNTKEDPIASIKTAYRDRQNGIFPSGGGGMATTPTDKVRIMLASLDAVLAGVETETNARKMARDDRAKLYAKIAVKRNVTAKDYEADLEARVAASLPTT